MENMNIPGSEFWFDIPSSNIFLLWYNKHINKLPTKMY